MDTIIRAAAIYVILLIIFRIAGKRSLAQITTFDFVLLLVVSEATQQGMLGEDYSITNAALVIITLVGIDVGLSLLKNRSARLSQWVDDAPLILVEEGQVLKRRMSKARLGEDDILEAAREKQGLERMDQIKYAVLERTGAISIIPKSGG